MKRMPLASARHFVAHTHPEFSVRSLSHASLGGTVPVDDDQQDVGDLVTGQRGEVGRVVLVAEVGPDDEAVVRRAVGRESVHDVLVVGRGLEGLRDLVPVRGGVGREFQEERVVVEALGRAELELAEVGLADQRLVLRPAPHDGAHAGPRLAHARVVQPGADATVVEPDDESGEPCEPDEVPLLHNSLLASMRVP